MDKNQCEIFAQFTYADSLTYEELLDAETVLIAQLDGILSASGGQHLDFTPLGDMLRCQCAFEVLDLPTFQNMADNIAAILPLGITGRLLILDKSLSVMHFFWLQRGSWQEILWPVPLVAPADATSCNVQVEDEVAANAEDDASQE